MLIALCLTAAVIAVLIRAPLLGLCVVALTGAALANGVVRAPTALVELRADVERGQAELSARLICHRRAVEALTSEDEQQLDAAEAACERAD